MASTTVPDLIPSPRSAGWYDSEETHHVYHPSGGGGAGRTFLARLAGDESGAPVTTTGASVTAREASLHRALPRSDKHKHIHVNSAQCTG